MLFTNNAWMAPRPIDPNNVYDLLLKAEYLAATLNAQFLLYLIRMARKEAGTLAQAADTKKAPHSTKAGGARQG